MQEDFKKVSPYNSKSDVSERYMRSITIEFNTYGDHKGKYTGKVKYENGQYESFQFIIRPDIAHRYIELISEDVVIGASELGERLKTSLTKQGLLSEK